MKLPTIPPGLAGKIVKNCPLSEPIRLQDFEDSPCSQAQKKINLFIHSSFVRSFVLSSLLKYTFNKEISSVYKSCSTDNATIVCFKKVIELLPVKKPWLDDDRKGTINFQEIVIEKLFRILT